MMTIINNMKWELVKRTMRLKFAFAAYIVLIVASLVVNEILYGIPVAVLYIDWRTLSNIVWMAFLFVAGYIMIVLPTLSMVTDLRSKNWVLERIQGCPFVFTAITRIIIGIAWVSLACGLLIFATWICRMSNVAINDVISDDANNWFHFYYAWFYSNYAWLVFYAAIVSPIVAMFATIASTIMVKRHKVVSFVVAAVLYLVIGYVILQVRELSIPMFAAIIVQFVMAMPLFIGACWLYDHMYEWV